MATRIPIDVLLMVQREALHMTQQQVAYEAGINIRQYQRLESGERDMRSVSMRIGLNLCNILKIDPFHFSDFYKSSGVMKDDFI